MSTRKKGNYFKSYGYSDEETLNTYKRRCKHILKDFCLKPEKTSELTAKIDKATSFAMVSRIMKEVRENL